MMNVNKMYPFSTQDDYLFPEGFFQELLILERKRTERSGKHFMLILIDIHKLLKIKSSNEPLKKLTRLLYQSTREIDIKGWYKQKSVIGIIYTEIHGVNKELLKEKISDTISKVLEPEYAALITFSCFCFPDSNHTTEVIQFANGFNLYRDSSMKRISKRVAVRFKRSVDMVGSFIGILILLPFLVIIAFLVKYSSKGPVFFRQKRIGYGGKEFTFLKFRSMYVNNDEVIHKEFTKNFIRGSNVNNNDTKEGIYKIERDPRITRVGGFLRKTSLDELPQLFNVLKGDMSLVGPRPPIRYEVEEYDIWHKRRVLEIKPGITGVWQVKGRSKTTFDEMVRMDIQYIKRWSPLLDLFLILKTPMAVFRAEGAY